MNVSWWFVVTLLVPASGCWLSCSWRSRLEEDPRGIGWGQCWADGISTKSLNDVKPVELVQGDVERPKLRSADLSHAALCGLNPFAWQVLVVPCFSPASSCGLSLWSPAGVYCSSPVMSEQILIRERIRWPGPEAKLALQMLNSWCSVNFANNCAQ